MLTLFADPLFYVLYLQPETAKHHLNEVKMIRLRPNYYSYSQSSNLPNLLNLDEALLSIYQSEFLKYSCC